MARGPVSLERPYVRKMVEVYRKRLVALALPTFFKLELDMRLETGLLQTFAAMVAIFVVHAVDVAASDGNLGDETDCHCWERNDSTLHLPSVGYALPYIGSA